MPVDIVPALRLFKQGPRIAPPSLTFQTDVHLSSITGGLKRLATFTLGFSEYIYSNHFGIIENLQAKPHQCKFHIQAESSQKLPIMGPFKCSIKRRTGRIMSASEPASTPAAQEPRQKSIKASRQEPNPTGWMDEVRARGSGRDAAKQSKHTGQPAAHLLLLAPLTSQCLYSFK